MPALSSSLPRLTLLLTLLVPLAVTSSAAMTAQGTSAKTPAPTGAPEPDLFQAAAEGDLARVRALLDGGIDPDTATRYGATALTFASDKGHTDIVRLLLERGADPDVQDTFYNQTPLAWALGNGHLDVAVLLVEHGAAGAEADALTTAARTGHPGLARAVLQRWKPYAYQRDLVLEIARREKHDEVVELLQAAEIRPLPEIEVQRETLARYTGVYGEVDVQLDPAQGKLVAEVPDLGSLALRPVTEQEFRGEDRLEVGLRFMGRSGMIEAVLLMQGTDVQYLPRANPETDSSTRSAESGQPSASDVAERKASATTPHPPNTSPHWPAFRGPGATGIGSGEPPVEWDVETGKHVLWKTEIPGLGHSSPVVWGDRIFLTTAIAASGNHEVRTGLTGDVSTVQDESEHTWKVLALDRDTGEILWQRTAGRAVPETQRHFKSTQANSTPVTDGRYVVAVFPTVGLVCYTVDGELEWKKDLGPLDAGWFYDPSYGWGFASSPILFEDLVILQADVQEGGFLAAWRLEDGEPVWRTERDDVPGFSTPTLVATDGGPELVANGSTVRGYDPRTGEELWRLGPNSELPIATPVTVPGRRSDRLVIVTAGYPPIRPIYGIRPGRRGDISPEDGPGGGSEKGPVAWSHDRGGAYMPTPLVYGDLFYLVHHNARLVAYEALTGEEVYKTRFSEGGTFTGSPVAADGRIYFPTEDGAIYVVEAGPEYRELAVNDMGEVVMTTPAIAEGTLFVRSLRHLWALGSEEGGPEDGEPARSSVTPEPSSRHVGGDQGVAQQHGEPETAEDRRRSGADPEAQGDGDHRDADGDVAQHRVVLPTLLLVGAQTAFLVFLATSTGTGIVTGNRHDKSSSGDARGRCS